jgi:DNA-binding NarL/FixJ family response regulator
MIHIAIVTRYEHDRQTIIALLAKHDDLQIVSIGIDGYDAITSVKLHHPDIIIMDFSMNDIESPDIVSIIKRNSPATTLMVLYSPEERNVVDKALKAGISGCLPRQDIADNLAASIRSVFHGGLYLSESVKNQALQGRKDSGLFEKILFPQVFFSPTELQIFYGIVCGHTDREIAKHLNLHTGSLRNCINQVKKRTGLQNRTQITAYALLSGIINIEKIIDSFNLIKPDRHID